jgi:hypothetical protein
MKVLMRFPHIVLSCILALAVVCCYGQATDQPKKIALGDLGLPTEQNAAASDLIIAELATEKRVHFIERQRLDTLLREAQLSLSGRVSPDKAVRLGQILNVDWFILGTRSALTNSDAIFLKVVEARTGVIRDVRPITIQEKIDLNEFVKNCASFIRENLATQNGATTRRFVTIGAFADLSLGGRLRTLPVQIRNYLLSAYQGSDVQILERDQVRWLTDELRLSLASISQTNNSAQSAFSALWTIDGKYQLLDGDELTAEMVLVVQKIGATPQEHRITGKVGEPLFSGIKAALDRAIARTRVARGSRNEIDVLLKRAMDLVGVMVRTNQGKPYFTGAPARNAALEDTEKRLTNVREAIKAVDSILLLDPENFEGRIFAADAVLRFDDRRLARKYAVEALPRAPDTAWAEVTRNIIAQTYYMSRDPDADAYLEKLDAETTDPEVKTQILTAREMVIELAVSEGRMGRDKLVAVTEKSLLNFLKGHYEHSLKTGEPMSANYNALLPLYNHDYGKAAAHLNRLLPEFRRQFPLRDLDVLGGAIGLQVDSNAPPVREGVAMLRDARTEAPSLPTLKRKSIRKSICTPLMYFGFRYAPEIFIEAYFTANALAGWEETNGDELKVMLAFAYERLDQRKEALEVLDSFGRRQIRMSTEGPWGKYDTLFIPQDKAMALRGEPVKLKASVGRSIAQSTTPIFTSIDGQTLWFVGGNRLHRADLSGAIAKQFALPNEQEQLPTAIAHDATTVYIGTYGGGLVTFDKRTEVIGVFRADQGLLVDSVTALHHDGSQLWIGYGFGSTTINAFLSPGGSGRSGGPGGLGWFNPATKKFGAFIPTIPRQVAKGDTSVGPEAADPKDGPPRQWVTSIASFGTNELWVGVLRKGIQRYTKSTRQWATYRATDIGQTISAIAADRELVAIACREAISYAAPTGYTPTRGGMSVTEGGKTNEGFELFNTEMGLPSNDLTALVWDDEALWVGGVDFICRMDRVFRKISAPLQVNGKVEQLTLSPGVIWASIGNELFRIEMPKL